MSLPGPIETLSKRPRVLLPVLLAAGVALAACAGQQAPVPEDHFYRLKVAAPKAPLAQPRFKGTLEVQRMIADGVIAGRPIVYSEAGKELEVLEYHYHFWTEPPIVLLMDQLVTYLRAANMAETVVTAEMRANADYAVSGKIKRLEQVRGANPRAIVEVELALLKKPEGKILFVRNYIDDQAADGEDVASAVQAMNTALGRIYARFAADISK